MMTLDEAILHAQMVAECKTHDADEEERRGYTQSARSCRECAEEHRQLAEWLQELKDMRGRCIDRAELFNRLAPVQTLAEAYEVIQDL